MGSDEKTQQASVAPAGRAPREGTSVPGPHHPQLAGHPRTPGNPIPEAFRARAASLGYSCVDLSSVVIPAGVLQLVPAAVARDERLMPLAVEGDALRIVMSDPPTPETLERLRFTLNHPLVVALAPAEAIAAAIERHYRSVGGEASAAPAEESAETTIDFVEIEESQQATIEQLDIPDPDSEPVGRTVQVLISEAFHLNASRLLILPVKDRVKLAYRIQDGVYIREDLAPNMLYPVLVRLMAMANLYGVIKVFLGEREQRLRVQFKATRHGLSAVVDLVPDPGFGERVRARASRLGYEYAALNQQPIEPSVLAMVPERIARDERILPVAFDGNMLVVATGEPCTPEKLDKLQFVLNRPVAAALAPEGVLLAAIQRYYGAPDPETADVILWELAQPAEVAEHGRPAAPPGPRLQSSLEPGHPAQAVLAHLGTVWRDRAFELFDDLRARARLCRRDPATGNLEVVFPQSHLMPLMPIRARRYLEDKIWGLREAILARLERFLAGDAPARGLAMAYSQYVAACRMVEGEAASINPATHADCWINFGYAFLLKSFPALDSNGTILNFVTEHLEQLSGCCRVLLESPDYVADAEAARQWMARTEKQLTLEDALDYDSPPVIHLVNLLLAEALHCRASHLLVLPWEDHVEVAYRVQRSVYRRDDLALRLLYPVLARLSVLANTPEALTVPIGTGQRNLRPTFRPTTYGLAALVAVQPDEAAVQQCQSAAAAAGLPFARLDDVDVPSPVLDLVPRGVARKMLMLPLSVHASTGAVTVALSEPPSVRRLNELRLLFNRQVSVVLAPEDDVIAAIYRHYHPAGTPAASAAAIALLQRGI